MNIKQYFHSSVKYLIPIALLGFVALCSRIPALAEWYMCNCYPIIAAMFSSISYILPFSLLDVLIIVVIVLFLGSIVMICMRRLSLRRWLKISFLSILWLPVWFYMAWGIGYLRIDFHERFGIEAPEEDREFFEAFVVRYIDSLNHAYLANPYFDAKEIEREIETMYAKHRSTLRLPHLYGWQRAKRTIMAPLITRMGVVGYFSPFTNEVHINDYDLPISWPYSLAHEKAHQFGIANEAECNLYATVICTSSKHPLVRYSGYLSTMRYLLNNLQKISPDRYGEIAGQIDPKIIADYNSIGEHWAKALNPTLSAMQNKVYDTYLKANKQQSGILSYSEMTSLLVAWELMRKTATE